MRIRYGEPQHARLTRHLFQQCLLLRVMHRIPIPTRVPDSQARMSTFPFSAASARRQRSHGHSRE